MPMNQDMVPANPPAKRLRANGGGHLSKPDPV